MGIVKKSIFVFCCILQLALAQLRVGFYNKSCPEAERIVRKVVQKWFDKDPSVTAALLHMQFHDCFVLGCDASLLIDSTKGINTAEKDAPPNLSVRGYDLIDDVKKKLESTCPLKVSCADVLTLATRDAVALAGGPNYKLPTGRRDGLVSNATLVILPGPQPFVSQQLPFFTAKGLNLSDMVTLLGAHTVGSAHCSFVHDRLFNFQGTGKSDPAMDRGLVASLSKICPADGKGNPTVFLDQNTSFVVDNRYYDQITKNRGVLVLDQNLALDRSSGPIVKSFASNDDLFRQKFGDVMIKMGNIEVLVGTAGEIRKNCRAFNRKS